MGIIKTYKVKVNEKDSDTTKEWTVNVERYDSAQEVVDDCNVRRITNSSFEDQSKKTFDSGWEGVNTYPEALDLLKNGYQPTVDKLQTALKVSKAGISKRVTFRNDIQGFAPVVPLALKGVPNSMVNMTMTPMKVKVIDIYYDSACSSGTSPETIIKTGQKLLSGIIELERQGYRFNLYAVQSYNGNGVNGSDVLCIKVKDSSRPLDLKRISFPLTHPAFFRVIGFDWYSKCPKANYRYGYGRSLRYIFDDDNIKKISKEAFGKNSVYVIGEILKGKGEEYIKEALINV